MEDSQGSCHNFLLCSTEGPVWRKAHSGSPVTVKYVGYSCLTEVSIKYMSFVAFEQTCLLGNFAPLFVVPCRIYP